MKLLKERPRALKQIILTEIVMVKQHNCPCLTAAQDPTGKR
jgi:hypothetical protein